MIIDLFKFLILGSQKDLDRFFERVQEKGCCEFLPDDTRQESDFPSLIKSFLLAIKILSKYPSEEKYQGTADFVLALQIAERVIELNHNLEKLYQEQQALKEKIVLVEPLGDFSVKDLNFIAKQTKRVAQFFLAPLNKRNSTDSLSDLIYLSTANGFDYFMSINPHRLSFPDMKEVDVDLELKEIKEKLEIVSNSINRFQNEIKDHVGYLDFLNSKLIEELNAYDITCAKKKVRYPLGNSFFAIEAWIPANKVAVFYEIIRDLDIVAERIAIRPDDRVPTYLDNRGLSLAGEDLIKIYDIPNPNDRDPSLWVLWFFSLFFAIIVGDGGYGLLLLGFAFYLQRKSAKFNAQQNRLLQLLFLLSLTSLGWGILAASYFGIHLSPYHFLSKISPIHYLIERKASYHFSIQDEIYRSWVAKYPELREWNSKEEKISAFTIQQGATKNYPILEECNNSLLIELTLILGMIHIGIALGRYLRRHIAGIGWILFMIGGYLVAPSFLNTISMIQWIALVPMEQAINLGKQLLLTGGGFVLFAAIVQHRLKGIFEWAHIIQLFSDILSYLRIYALNLAGAIIAATFNKEGADLGLFFGGVVIILGHALNLGLALMGGIIHGLRLNFLEWYHYCFKGGGRLFKPLLRRITYR